MNQAPNPRTPGSRPVARRTVPAPASRPAGQPSPRPAGTRPPQKRPPQKKKLRPLAVFLIALIVLLACVIVFLIVYNASYNAEKARLEKAPGEQQTKVDTGKEETPPQEETPPAEEPAPEERPAPDKTFSSLDEIVSYVDSLGIDFTDRASFSMDGYFTSATLKKTADAGDAYQNNTAYIGDSLVLHMGVRSSHPKNMVYGAASINPEDACTKKLATLKDGTEATFAEAMAELRPARIVISIGTNSMWMEPTVYLQFMNHFLDQLKAACPTTELILQSTPPLTAEYEEGKNFPTNEKINRFNMYLAGLASYRGIWYLNSAEGLKNSAGTLSDEFDSDGFHISAEGYDVWTDYLRTHATTLQK